MQRHTHTHTERNATAGIIGMASETCREGWLLQARFGAQRERRVALFSRAAERARRKSEAMALHRRAVRRGADEGARFALEIPTRRRLRRRLRRLRHRFALRRQRRLGVFVPAARGRGRGGAAPPSARAHYVPRRARRRPARETSSPGARRRLAGARECRGGTLRPRSRLGRLSGRAGGRTIGWPKSRGSPSTRGRRALANGTRRRAATIETKLRSSRHTRRTLPVGGGDRQNVLAHAVLQAAMDARGEGREHARDGACQAESDEKWPPTVTDRGFAVPRANDQLVECQLHQRRGGAPGGGRVAYARRAARRSLTA